MRCPGDSMSGATNWKGCSCNMTVEDDFYDTYYHFELETIYIRNENGTNVTHNHTTTMMKQYSEISMYLENFHFFNNTCVSRHVL